MDEQYQRHPLSSAFPSMEAIDFDALTADVMANGLHDAIAIYEGRVLDGWHRYQACLCSAVEPRFFEYHDTDPVAFVRSKNQHRRHLTQGQKAAIETALNAWALTGRPGNPVVTTGFSSATTATMAKNAGVSESAIQRAKVAQRAGLGEDVREGRITLDTAVRIAKLPEPERAAAIADPEKLLPPSHSDDADELESRMRELTDDLAAYMKIAEGQEAVADELKRLAREIETLTIARDSQMAKNAIMAKQLKALQRKLEKYEKGNGN